MPMQQTNQRAVARAKVAERCYALSTVNNVPNANVSDDSVITIERKSEGKARAREPKRKKKVAPRPAGNSECKCTLDELL